MHRKEIKFILNYLDNNREYLDTLQHEFLASLKKQYYTTGVLTQRQAEFLYEYILSLTPDNNVFEAETEKYRESLYSSFDNPTTLSI